jgi:L-ascorbate metabolism protein UlaG (beta-lactamase superfamily)
MIHWTLLGIGCYLAFAAPVALAGSEHEQDTIPTSAGPLRLTFLGHATLMMEFDGKVIHVDPWTQQADYAKLPKADLILVTHEHFDHLDPAAIAMLRKGSTIVIASGAAASKIGGARVMKNGDELTTMGLKIEAVPAYNIVHMKAPGQPFHPKGVGNGYVVTFGDKRVYIAGDTENIPEMKRLKNIDVAFLPMNLPYTMTPDEVAEAARMFKPKILYPYHYGETDTAKLTALMRADKGIEVRIRRMP